MGDVHASPLSRVKVSVFIEPHQGLSGTVREHERAVFGLNGEVESDMHGCPFPHGDIDDSRALQICLRELCQNQGTSPVQHGQTSAPGLNG